MNEPRAALPPACRATSAGGGQRPRPGGDPAGDVGTPVRSLWEGGLPVPARARPRARALSERQPRCRPNPPSHHRAGGVRGRPAVRAELRAAPAGARGDLDGQPHAAAATPAPRARAGAEAEAPPQTPRAKGEAPIAGRRGEPVPRASAVAGRAMAGRVGGAPSPGSPGPVRLAGLVVARLQRSRNLLSRRPGLPPPRRLSLAGGRAVPLRPDAADLPRPGAGRPQRDLGAGLGGDAPRR